VHPLNCDPQVLPHPATYPGHFGFASDTSADPMAKAKVRPMKILGSILLDGMAAFLLIPMPRGGDRRDRWHLDPDRASDYAGGSAGLRKRE
jgi:hypothetical protein